MGVVSPSDDSALIFKHYDRQRHLIVNAMIQIPRQFSCLLFSFLTLSVLMPEAKAAAASAKELANPYYRLTPLPGGEIGVAFDASGKGDYIETGARLGVFDSQENGSAELVGRKIEVRSAGYVMPKVERRGVLMPFEKSVALPENQTLGQSFVFPEKSGLISALRVPIRKNVGQHTVIQVTLREEGPKGRVIEEKTVSLPLISFFVWTLEKPLPPGKYFISGKVLFGKAEWRGTSKDIFPEGSAFLNDKPVEGEDRLVQWVLNDRGTVDWEVWLDGPRMRFKVLDHQPELKGNLPPVALSFPWEKNGYDTTDPAVTPFRYALSDSLQYKPVEAYKRWDADWALEFEARQVRLGGTRGFDYLITPGRKKYTPRMESDRLYVLLGDNASVQIEPTPDDALARFPKFFSSDKAFDAKANEFFLNHLTQLSGTPVNLEWDSIKLDWVGGPRLQALQQALRHFSKRVDPDGYVWARTEGPGWDGSDCTNADFRMPETSPRFISAVWNAYRWSGDKAFLDDTMPTVRKAMGYMMNAMDGETGSLTMKSPHKTGVVGAKGPAVPSNYMDHLPTGWLDAYTNTLLLTSLDAYANLERAAGDPAAAEKAEKMIPLARQKFNELFWNPEKGRYIEWIDKEGTRYDFGATYVNTMATAAGYPSEEQAIKIYDWMENKPTASGEADTFSRWVFAPRSHTEDCYVMPSKHAWEVWCENGGAILFFSYYDLMSRLRYFGPENAWKRFREIVDRAAMPDKLFGGNPLYRGEINNHNGVLGSVGTWGDFPESGMVPAFFAVGIVGLSATPENLIVRPQLPAELEFAGVEGFEYLGRRVKVTSYRDRVVLDIDGKTETRPLENGVARFPAIMFGESGKES